MRRRGKTYRGDKRFTRKPGQGEEDGDRTKGVIIKTSKTEEGK